ncbi:hypothetical protein ACHAXT_003986 [Thalassiosira profunda]
MAADTFGRAGSNATFLALQDIAPFHRITPQWFAPNAHDFVSQYDTKECRPIEEWQLDGRPTCNDFHELDLTELRFLAEGGARAVFAATDGAGQASLDEQRRDALVMDRASRSRFVPDVHGFCGAGIMMPSLPDGDMLDYTRHARLAGGSSLPPVDRLRIALHIASGVADVHTMTLFYHNDVTQDQFLFHDGVFQLQDFNYASPFYANRTSEEHCTHDKYESLNSQWKGRSLDEFQKHLNYANYTAPDPAKATARKLLRGERSLFPPHIANSTDSSHVAVKNALDMCWRFQWRDRPSAAAIASYLHDRLRQITGEDDPDIRVTLPERDPKRKLSWSDFFHVNCDRRPDGRVKEC